MDSNVDGASTTSSTLPNTLLKSPSGMLQSGALGTRIAAIVAAARSPLSQEERRLVCNRMCKLGCMYM